MNTIKDNERFIDFTNGGNIHSLCKDYVRAIKKINSSNSVFLNMLDDVGVSLAPQDYQMILDPTHNYPTLDKFYTDIHKLLNDDSPTATYSS